MDCIAYGDPTPLHTTALALMELQRRYGLIGRIQGKGPAAAAVRDMLARMRREAPPPPPPPPGSGVPRISRAILIDREVDLITPLMTQLTFEGLLDEVVGVRCGAVTWPPAAGAGAASGGGGDGVAAGAAGGSAAAAAGGAAAASGGGSGVALLNSSDPLFRELRDLPFHICAARHVHYMIKPFIFVVLVDACIKTHIASFLLLK